MKASLVGIVDDDASVRESVSSLLRSAGYDCAQFESADALLGSGRLDALDCLVLDIHLGILTGFDVHEQLVASGVSIPTIFITGYDEAATRERAKNAGAAAYLAKPFEDQALISAIEAALAGA